MLYNRSLLNLISRNRMSDNFKQQALNYHLEPKPGKISIAPTKSMSNQRDLALAYSPGVAYACEEIVNDAAQAANMTSRGNLVAVITNGTAVLGLGNIGPLASKPVMEGKGVLFKKFADIDVFDIEINEKDPDKFVEIVASLEPTFGGINLEDIKAPECFFIEQKLKERLNIPVFHDDQHGTAIIATAALLNALSIQGKELNNIKVVASGAGAAGMACLDLFISLGIKRKNIIVCDSKGVIYKGRAGADQGKKAEFAADTNLRTLAEAIKDTDVFLGVSQAGLLTGEMVKSMAAKPLILALANPTPEIMPEEVKAVRDDAIIATGRSDYPNQVNNVLCFPYIFRGALDVGATEINEEMKLACVRAIAELAKSPVGEEVMDAYNNRKLDYGPDYVIPTPFDPRLISVIPSAVAKAAMETGVATRPIEDFDRYQENLFAMIDKSGMAMKPVFEAAKADPKRVIFAEGEETRVLRAVSELVDEGIVKPVLLGRREFIIQKIKQIGLSLEIDKDFQLIDPLNNPHYRECISHYQNLCGRIGVDPHIAKINITTRMTILGAVLINLGYADTMICGVFDRYQSHLYHVKTILGLREGVINPAAMSMLVGPKGTMFIADVQVTKKPTTEEIINITELCVKNVYKFGVKPKVAMLSYSNFGSQLGEYDVDKMAEAATFLREKYPELMIDGEMQADSALSERVRHDALPNSPLTGSANVLIMPTLDAANICASMMRVMSDSVSMGPILMGLARPIHIVSRTSSIRQIINMSAIAVVDAQEYTLSHPQQ